MGLFDKLKRNASPKLLTSNSNIPETTDQATDSPAQDPVPALEIRPNNAGQPVLYYRGTQRIVPNDERDKWVDHDVYIFTVAGWNYQEDIVKTVNLSSGRKVVLLPEPKNEYDKNAIKITVPFAGKPTKIGYVPADMAKKLAPRIFKRPKLVARIVRGPGRGELPQMGILVMVATKERIDAVFSNES